jgi:hypothetical protein
MWLDDRLKRDLSRLAAETDPDVEPALQRVVSGGRRRKMMYRAGLALGAAAVVAVAAFATPRVLDALEADAPARPGATPGRSPTATESPMAEETVSPVQTGDGGTILVQGDFDCGGDVPFLPGYLPEGFSDEPIPGPAPGAPPWEEGQLVVHWTDGERAFEVRNPGTLFVEIAQEDDAPTITVLGRETADFGPIVPMEEDYIVQFTLGSKGDRCSLWSLNEYGLSLDELKSVAEGLG